MHDFTITTVGRKEVSFTFEDAMYVAAAAWAFHMQMYRAYWNL